ncbi:MAG: hypothetical protein KIPDCIKN_02869 [Haliscomenobacter sp.]|nr:hypothetical protein [Haliscomenobacter sp.]
MYALQLDGIFTYQNGNKGIDQYHLCYKFDLASKTAKLMPVHFPRELWENGIIELNTSWTFNGDRWVFAPVHSNQIFATPDLNAFNAVYSSSSRHMAPFQGYDPNETASKPWKEYAVDFLSHGEFTGFAFDPWRGCYYRFFFPGMKNAQDLAQPEKAIQDPPLLGLLVLNEAFETVLDTLLPERTYSHHHFFIGKKGLYLAVNHPEYPNLKEDTLAFHVLSLRNGGN